MTATVKMSRLTSVSGATGGERFCVEASDLGFPPGLWPEHLIVVDDNPQMPIAEWILRKTDVIGGVDFDGYVYRSADGAVSVSVFND